MNEILKAGFEYKIELLRNGIIVPEHTEIIRNLVPTEGLNHFLGVALKSVSPIATWYVSLYEGNYSPSGTDTAAAFPGASTETTAYAESVRQTLVLGSVVAGAVDNSASKAVFTFNATKTIYGGAISSTSTKGSTSGILLSAVRFSSPKPMTADAVLRVTAGFTIASA